MTEDLNRQITNAIRRIGRLEKNYKNLSDDLMSVKNITETIRAETGSLKTTIDTIHNETAQILYLFNAAKETKGFVKKYGKQVIVFGAGVMSAAGIGNPNVLEFVKSFFGG